MTLSSEWILGAIIAILSAVLGFAFKRISDLEARIDANRGTIDAVKDAYVRRDDMSRAIGVVADDLKEVKSDVKASAGMIVQLLLEFGAKAPKPRSRAP